MEKYPKMFIKASIIYLLLGVLFGLAMSYNLIDSINPVFIHVHFNLFGFMAMMVFGVAYHILPRFNAKPIKHPVLIPFHFYLGNIGLIGMVLSYSMDGYSNINGWSPIFHISALMSASAVFLFVFNMFPVLMDNKDEEISPMPKSRPIKTNEKSPSTISGPIPKSMPLQSTPSPSMPLPTTPPSQASPLTSNTINKGEKCTKGVIIGDLIKVYPETKKVFEKSYGAGCFSCPGQETETIEQTTQMHGIDIDIILSEINEIIEKEI